MSGPVKQTKFTLTRSPFTTIGRTLYSTLEITLLHFIHSSFHFPCSTTFSLVGDLSYIWLATKRYIRGVDVEFQRVIILAWCLKALYKRFSHCELRLPPTPSPAPRLKKKQSYSSTPPYAFTAGYKVKFTFTLYLLPFPCIRLYVASMCSNVTLLRSLVTGYVVYGSPFWVTA